LRDQPALLIKALKSPSGLEYKPCSQRKARRSGRILNRILNSAANIDRRAAMADNKPVDTESIQGDKKPEEIPKNTNKTFASTFPSKGANNQQVREWMETGLLDRGMDKSLAQRVTWKGSDLWKLRPFDVRAALLRWGFGLQNAEYLAMDIADILRVRALYLSR
jgi:hypothetical protein